MPRSKKQTESLPAPKFTRESSGATEVCHGCGYIRPLEEFTDQEIPARMGQWELLCSQCREHGKPEAAPLDWSGVAPQHRKLLQAMFFEGKTYPEAQAEAGINPNRHLADILAKNPNTRALYQRILNAAGLDIAFLAQKIRVQLHARKPFYDPSRNETYWIPDNQAIGRAIELLAKHHDIAAEREREKGDRPPVIHIHTNLGEQVKIEEGAQGVFVASVERSEPIDVTPEAEP